MKWKVFAVASVISLIYGLVTYDARSMIDLVAAPVDIVATVGLLAYAFYLRPVYSSFWIMFAWFFVVWSIFSMIVGVVRGSAGGSPVYAIVGGSLIAAALLYPNWLALHRLGRAEYD